MNEFLLLRRQSFVSGMGRFIFIVFSLLTIILVDSCVHQKKGSTTFPHNQIIYIQRNLNGDSVCVIDIDSRKKQIICGGFEGNELQNLTSSPCGRWIAFQEGNTPAFPDGGYSNYFLGVIQLIDYKISKIADFNITYNQTCSWSNDGNYIAYGVGDDETMRSIELLDLRNDETMMLNEKIWLEYSAWSPNGNKLAIVSLLREGLSIIDIADRSIIKRYSSDSYDSLTTWVEWLSNDTLLCYSSYNIPMYRLCLNSGKKQIINSSQAHTIINDPVVSPDMKLIAFRGQAIADTTRWQIAEYDSQEVYQYSANIYVMETDGSNFRKITNIGDAMQPSWSPDSKQIVFVSHKKGQEGLYIVDSQGGNLSRLIDFEAGTIHYPVWIRTKHR